MKAPDEKENERVPELLPEIAPSWFRVAEALQLGLEVWRNEVAGSVRPRLREIGARILAVVRENIVEHTERIGRMQSALVRRSWYLQTIDFQLIDGPGFQARFDAGEYEASDAIIAQFVRERCAIIESEAQSKWPKRWPVLHDAFEAHRNGKYTLSIPAFLTQIDGISRDEFGAQFFGKIRNTSAPKTSAGVGANNDQMDIAMIMSSFTYLGELFSLNEGFHQPDWESGTVATQSGDRSTLDRHAVLHGYDPEYASEENSLRLVLILRYLYRISRLLNDSQDDDLTLAERMGLDEDETSQPVIPGILPGLFK